ncbi:MAG: ACP S-malonyltransferase [Planctomycetota bacterium]
MTRAFLILPGRGSYTEKSLGSLPKGHPWVAHADAYRASLELPPLSELDAAEKFSSKLHLRPANVSALIYLVSMLDAAEAASRHQLVAIAGNSMGWYTALAAGGALSFEDGLRLVQEMALLQEQHPEGGQVIYPLVDDEWRPDAERRAAVEAALASSGGDARHSIHLGGYAVLAGTEVGIRHLLDHLPKVKVGAIPYPFRLMQHGPYHTPWVEPVSRAARERLASLEFSAPTATLIDGDGRRQTPWTSDPAEIREYTFGRQVTEPYDLTRSILVGLREFAPDRVVLPGPGNTLGGIVGQVLVEEGWRGVRSKSDFQVAQSSDAPIVESMRR